MERVTKTRNWRREPTRDPPYPAAEMVWEAGPPLLNGTARNGARHVIAHKREMVGVILGQDDLPETSISELWRMAEAMHPGYAQAASDKAQWLIGALLTKHSPIAPLFFKGVGLRLQRRDSDIAEGVMREMRQRGIVVLPVHDSFLAPASKAAELEAVMVEEATKFGASVFCTCSSTVPTG